MLLKDSVTLWGRLNTEQTDEKRSNMIIHCRPRLPCQLYAVLYWTDGHKVNMTVITDNHYEKCHSRGMGNFLNFMGNWYFIIF